MGVNTSAMVWFGFPGELDFVFADREFRDLEGDKTATVVDVGWYDSNYPALAVPGTVSCAWDFGGTPMKSFGNVSAKKIAALKETAAKHNFPTEGKEPAWYFSPRQS